MPRGIYLIQGDGELVEMSERPYDSEALLQGLLARYPSLLAGDQIDPASPRRWVLISREQPVPDESAGAARWAIDHLFVDQDGVPTLVEVKRSTDTRIRREIVGQTLDYAANAVVYWPAEAIRTRFEARCVADKQEPDDVPRSALGVEPGGVEDFWQAVKTNLQAGRVRLVFVADVIPMELKRVIEFLNGQMDPAEVLGIEIRQYVGTGLRTLVPGVVGQTSGAQEKKSPPRARRTWDSESFRAEVRRGLPGPQADAVEAILDACAPLAEDMGYGTGITGSISPKFAGASTRSFFTLRANGTLQINKQWHDQPDAGESAPRYRDEFLHRLQSGGLGVPDTPYPTLSPDVWTPRAALIVEVVRDLFGNTRR